MSKNVKYTVYTLNGKELKPSITKEEVFFAVLSELPAKNLTLTGTTFTKNIAGDKLILQKGIRKRMFVIPYGNQERTTASWKTNYDFTADICNLRIWLDDYPKDINYCARNYRAEKIPKIEIAQIQEVLDILEQYPETVQVTKHSRQEFDMNPLNCAISFIRCGEELLSIYSKPIVWSKNNIIPLFVVTDSKKHLGFHYLDETYYIVKKLYDIGMNFDEYRRNKISENARKQRMNLK